jgi:hypothetical protein
VEQQAPGAAGQSLRIALRTCRFDSRKAHSLRQGVAVGIASCRRAGHVDRAPISTRAGTHIFTIEPQRAYKPSLAQHRRLYSSPNIPQHRNLLIDGGMEGAD